MVLVLQVLKYPSAFSLLLIQYLMRYDRIKKKKKNWNLFHKVIPDSCGFNWLQSKFLSLLFAYNVRYLWTKTLCLSLWIIVYLRTDTGVWYRIGRNLAILSSGNPHFRMKGIDKDTCKSLWPLFSLEECKDSLSTPLAWEDPQTSDLNIRVGNWRNRF